MAELLELGAAPEQHDLVRGQWHDVSRFDNQRR